MQGQVDTSFETLQRDIFASGMAATIGMNAFGVWIAIKSHADYNTGECWPGIRRLSDLTGLASGTVQKAVHTLIDAKLLRIASAGVGKRSNRYVARERLDVRLGERVLCDHCIQITRDSMTGKPALDAAMGRLGETVRKRDEVQAAHLPPWPDNRRGTPNSFIRSALFSAIQGKDRTYLSEAVLFTQQGVTIKYTGQQLNQYDLTIWETLVHLARSQPLGHLCNFTAHTLLQELSLPTGGEQHKPLHSAIIRLTACAVQITHEGKTYFGPLIKSGVKDEVTSHYHIELNRELIRLYGETQWTAIDWQQRVKLRRKPLAQALHAFYSSRRTPFPLKVSYLQQLTGCRNSQPASFKRQCRTAFSELVKIGFLQEYTMEGDTVTVKRCPSSPRDQ